jgi:hypothetical protein
VVFAKDQSRYVDDHFCYVINHRVNALTGTGTGFGREAYLWLEQRGIKVPSTMINVEYHRSAIPGNALYIWYYFNPEYDGFSPSADSAWTRNDWHKDFINRDVKKVAYVDALKSWATAMAPVVDRGFRGEKVEPEAYAKWPSVP